MKNLFPERSATAVSDEDRSRLKGSIHSWGRLNEILREDGIDRDDCEKLIIMESEGKQRPTILKKLIGRLTTLISHDLYDELDLPRKKKRGWGSAKVKGADDELL